MAHNNIGYLEGCASKYASRWDRKGAPIVDLEKGIHYCDKIIEMIENIGYKASGYAPDFQLARFFLENEINDDAARVAITRLCQWRCKSEIQEAQAAISKLLGKARAAA
jgi:hypothetical protein